LFAAFAEMLAKKTSKNQITLPKAIISRFPDTEYFDVREEDGHIILVPLRPSRANEVRDKLAELNGITESDVNDAVRWVRQL
jgi:bifunctional DNA-binding transcriptional regulator/antitoxin component of YhaV-PrlF toxin-antitoxin module